jgi:hypothetical protein
MCTQCEIDRKQPTPPSHREKCTSCEQELLLVDCRKLSPREWTDEQTGKTVRISNERDAKEYYLYFCWSCELPCSKADELYRKRQ